MKTYEGTRAGDYGTAIIVVELPDWPTVELPSMTVSKAAQAVRRNEYPLPYVDAWELERRVFGSVIPGADTLGTRTFEWGYHGAGPRDTASSILADWYGQPQPHQVIQRFKDDVVARLGGAERGRFRLPGGVIQAWAKANASLIEAAWARVEEERRYQQEFDVDPPSEN